MTVLVFDSGIGGLSVLREVRLVLPGHRIVYIGDDAGFPYGDWEEQSLTAHMVALFERFIEQFSPDLVIVACNTASTLIMPALRQRFDIPIAGIVPAIKPAAELTASGLITVLATPGTIARRYTRQLIEEFASGIEVNLVGATRLARMAENHMQQIPIKLEDLREEIAPCFIERDSRRTDIVTLGCTHYPFLVSQMRKVAPWPVDWLNPAEAVARHAASLLDSHDEILTEPGVAVSTEAGDLAIMTSGNPPAAVVRLLSGAGLMVGRGQVISTAHNRLQE